MFPFAVIPIAIWAARKAFGPKGASTDVSRTPWLDGFGWTFLLWFTALMVFVVAATGIVVATPLRLLLTLGALPFVFPGRLVRRVLVPLGLPRASFVVAWMGPWQFLQDRRGGACVAAALALARMAPGRRTSARAWVERRMGRKRLGGARVLAAGLVAEAEGNRLLAKSLMQGVAMFRTRNVDRRARWMAIEWQVAEAASEGRWTEVDTLTRLGPRTRRIAFLGAVARRMRGARLPPSNLMLRLFWLMSPSRWRLRGLLADAMEMPTEPHARSTGTSERSATWDETLRCHLTTLGEENPELPESALAEVARNWDALQSSEPWRQAVGARASELGVENASPVVDAVFERVREDLTRYAQAHPVRFGPELALGPLLEQALGASREALLRELESRVDALCGRSDEGTELGPLDELQEFLGVQDCYLRAVGLGGLPTRRVAFALLKNPVCNHAVWLFNERKERLLGNAIFTWLSLEAEAVGSEESAKLNRKNAAVPL